MVLKDIILIRTISSQGQGPGEFLGASALIVKNDTLFVYDDVKREIILFHNGNYIRSIQTRFNTIDGNTSCFNILDDCFVISDFEYPNSLLFLNIYSDSLMRFGKMFDFNSPVKNRNRNRRHVFTSSNSIYSVSNNQPVTDTVVKDKCIVLLYNEMYCESCVVKGFEVVKQIDSLIQSKTYIITSSPNPGRQQLINEYSQIQHVLFPGIDSQNEEEKFIISCLSSMDDTTSKPPPPR